MCQAVKRKKLCQSGGSFVLKEDCESSNIVYWFIA